MRYVLALAGLFSILTSAAWGQSPELCPERLARMSASSPLLLSAEGTHHDATYVMASWSLEPSDADEAIPGAMGAFNFAGHIAEQIIAYGRDERGIPYDAEPLTRVAYAVRWLVAELMNNAAYHGNQGDPNRPVRVRVTLSGDEAVIRISDQGTFFDVTPFTQEPDWDAMWTDYEGPATGGSLGIRLVLPAYVKDYGFDVKSERRDDGDGVDRTDVVIRVPLSHAMAVVPRAD